MKKSTLLLSLVAAALILPILLAILLKEDEPIIESAPIVQDEIMIESID